MTEDQQALLEKIAAEYPAGWFNARSVRATRAEVEALVELGHLIKSKGYRGQGIHYRIPKRRQVEEQDDG